jgi:hypothetical protein
MCILNTAVNKQISDLCNNFALIIPIMLLIINKYVTRFINLSLLFQLFYAWHSNKIFSRIMLSIMM